MTNRIMAVYDVDPFYADRFADFVNQKEKVPFTVMAFTTLERLKNYAMEHEIELLLINSTVPKEEIDRLGAARVVTLADGETVPVDGQYPSVYKYQATDNIMREVMACYCVGTTQPALTAIGNVGDIIGVYSPVNRCLKTSFALTAGQLLSRKSRVLYVNLEDCSGLEKLFGEEHKADLSDLLYFYGQGNYSWVRLSSVIYSWGDLDYIPPVRYPEDLCQITAEDMADLLTRIAKESAYDIVVVDLGQFGKKAASVLEVCSTVFMPVKDDCMSVAKVEEFEEYLVRSGHEAIKERIQKIKLPYHSSFGRKENYLEQLLWGELGDYTRQLLKGR